ncbi:piRNA biogenesis protein EXD1 isoform X3 [Scyliorhinus torazame]|uniref:piRNA biogenesis protein EXD1 isoform X3 n=1 Tax=Scyliorhinus torazame TaxID=75743 RepID=UPI003B5AE294
MWMLLRRPSYWIKLKIWKTTGSCLASKCFLGMRSKIWRFSMPCPPATPTNRRLRQQMSTITKGTNRRTPLQRSLSMSNISQIFHIKQQSVIGVAVEGIDICRFGKLCLIQIATNDQIYLFDIFLLGPVAFKNGLKMILEDSDILKVIHDCRLVSDCLYHQYRVGLTNIFDTQVADVLQFSLEAGGLLPSCVSTLAESLVCHLCLPPTKALFLQRSARAVKVNPKVWTCRPLPAGLMQRAGLDVMYLLSLRSALMDKLMVDFTTQVDNYLSMYRNMPCINLGSAENYLMELPYELKELTVIQRLRREDALKNYKVDENGLLVRPCPQSEKIPEMKGRVVNIDDIPELEATDPSGENVLEMQNEDIPLLEPSPDCGEDRCPPLEEVSRSTF